MTRKLVMAVAAAAAYPPREASAEGISPERSENCEAISLTTMSRLHRSRCCQFDGYSENWLDFIVRCRDLVDDSDWDVVVGGVANDKVFDTLEAFFDGFATKAQTIDRLRIEKPNLQICFRTGAALQTLKFVGSEQI